MAKGGGGSREASRSVQVYNPWIKQAPYLERLYGRAERAYGQPLQYYPTSTIAERSPETMEALRRTEYRAGMGSDQLREAQQLNMATMRGEFLEGNPILDREFGRVAGQIGEHYNRTVLNDLESRFAGAGARRSGAYQGALTRSQGELAGSLTDAATDIYYRNYLSERGAQERAMGMAPQFAREDYYDIDRLAAAGQQEDVYLQDLLNDLVERWNFQQGEPWERLGLFQEAIGGPVAGGGTTSLSGKTGPRSIDWGRGLASMLGFG